MFHMNIDCLQLVGKISVSELNLKCGRQKYALKLLWPVATKKRQQTVVMIAAGRSNPFFGVCLFESRIKCVVDRPSTGCKVMVSSIGESKKWQRKRIKTETHNDSNKNQSEKLFRAHFFAVRTQIGNQRNGNTNTYCTIIIIIQYTPPLHVVCDRKYFTTTFTINGLSLSR